MLYVAGFAIAALAVSFLGLASFSLLMLMQGMVL